MHVYVPFSLWRWLILSRADFQVVAALPMSMNPNSRPSTSYKIYQMSMCRVLISKDCYKEQQKQPSKIKCEQCVPFGDFEGLKLLVYLSSFILEVLLAYHNEIKINMVKTIQELIYSLMTWVQFDQPRQLSIDLCISIWLYWGVGWKDRGIDLLLS